MLGYKVLNMPVRFIHSYLIYKIASSQYGTKSWFHVKSANLLADDRKNLHEAKVCRSSIGSCFKGVASECDKNKLVVLNSIC